MEVAMRRTAIGVALCVVAAAAAFGQDPPALTVDWVFSDEAESVARVPRWRIDLEWMIARSF